MLLRAMGRVLYDQCMTNAQLFYVDTRFPGGNATRIRVTEGDPLQLQFTCEPKGGRPLWFYLRLKPSAEIKPAADAKFRLVLEHYDTLAGAQQVAECCPVYRPSGQWWMRLPGGKVERTEDGRLSATWTLNVPTEPMELALCPPYEPVDLRQLVEKSRGAWLQERLGLSQGGRDVVRLANGYDSASRFAGGLYIVGRERGADMPSAWVLDGLLQRLAGAKNNPFLTWAVPLADVDGAHSGAWRSEPDLHTGWVGGSSERHEIAMLKQDVLRWRGSCRPSLGLSIRAAALGETSGIYCELPNEAAYGEFHAQALKWAHVIQAKLGAEFASPDFVRVADKADTGRFHDWMAREVGICALTLCVPWASAGETVFSQKKYREAGKNVADAMIEKRR